MPFESRLYRGGHPNGIARAMNRIWSFLHSLGIAPNYLVTLEVVGRRYGKSINFPLVMTVVNGERYLVSMLGEDANWVLNAVAARGSANLWHGRREHVILELVNVQYRAAIIKAYVRIAPGARPHIPIDPDSPIAQFEEIASKYPVFRIRTSVSTETGSQPS